MTGGKARIYNGDMLIKIHLGKLLGERKLRAAEISRKTGIAPNALSALYHEQVSGIKFETLEKLCSVLSCAVSDLLEYMPRSSQSKIFKIKNRQ